MIRAVAAEDAYGTDEGTTLVITAPGVLANDSDPDGDALSTLLASEPFQGSLSLGADGSFIYTPAGGFVGTDAFT